jgi:DNA-directed RNA polymerase specialized sigma24 family protein
MERDDGSSERSTTDEFLEAASSERALQDIELFNWLFAAAKRRVRSLFRGPVSTGDVEDLAAKAIDKFYRTFHFAGLAGLPIEHARNRLFYFLNVIVEQTVTDHWRDMERGRQNQQIQLPLIEISEDQWPAAAAAIKRLPKSEKEFLQLKLVDNLTYAQIQACYTKPRKKPPTISGMKTRMHRLMKKLRGQF